MSSSKNYNMLTTPLVTPIASKFRNGEFFNMLNPKLQSDLLSDHSRHISFDYIHTLQAESLSLWRIICMKLEGSVRRNPTHPLYSRKTLPLTITSVTLIADCFTDQAHSAELKHSNLYLCT